MAAFNEAIIITFPVVIYEQGKAFSILGGLSFLTFLGSKFIILYNIIPI